MKKVLSLLLVVMLALGALVAPAAATPIDELTDLGRYFPAGTPIFATIRTDDAYIDTLDSVLATVADALPADAGLDGVSLRALLNMAFGFGMSFDADIRPWLGDSVALGLTSIDALTDADPFNDQEGVVIAIALADAEAAEAFFVDGMMQGDDFVTETVGDFTVYSSEAGDDGALAIGADVALLGLGSVADLQLDGDFTPLTADPAFTELTGLMPADEYNIFIYAALNDFFDAFVSMMTADAPGMDMQAFEMLQGLTASVGSYGLGFTVLDGRSLTIDLVGTLGDTSAIEALGLPVLPTGTVDLAFANRIPAGTAIVTHADNLRQIYDSFIAGFELGAQTSGDPEAGEEIGQALEQVDFIIRGLTGLDLEEDILSWMTGDFAIHLGLSESAQEATSLFGFLGALPVDFGLLIEATEPDVAANLASGLADAIDFAASQIDEDDDLQLTVTNETSAGTSVVVVTVDAPDLPFPLELLIAGNDEVFALGTRAAVEAALDPATGLNDDPQFNEALAYVLDAPNQIHYLSGVSLQALSALATTEDDQAVLESALGLISSSTISSAVIGDNASAIRLVLTLPE
ncbi:MAG: DUF3352 domain-containing protein [Chloroflexi bacterium]|nr:DUF3352 domain-containing protein [Chloroflexota bacterium]